MQTPDGIRILGDLQRLELKPDDGLVLMTDMPLDRATVDRLKAVVEEAFPGRRVLVLSDGLKIAAVSLAAESAEDFVRRDLVNGLEAHRNADR